MPIRYLLLCTAVALGAELLPAQSVREQIALGDSAHAAMHPEEALAHYKQALAIDSTDYEALYKASRESVDLGEFERDRGKRAAYFRDGERYARRAIAADSADAEGHFDLARALGRVALTLGAKERVRYAKEVRAQALEALRLNPRHGGALHVMGRWNAEVMRLSGLSRFVAKSFLGGGVFGQASWNEAVRYMEESVAVDPTRLTHHLDLGEIYADVGEKAKAREQLELVINGRATDYNDQFYKQEAEKRLERLR